MQMDRRILRLCQCRADQIVGEQFGIVPARRSKDHGAFPDHGSTTFHEGERFKPRRQCRIAVEARHLIVGDGIEAF